MKWSIRIQMAMLSYKWCGKVWGENLTLAEEMRQSKEESMGAVQEKLFVPTENKMVEKSKRGEEFKF